MLISPLKGYEYLLSGSSTVSTHFKTKETAYVNIICEHFKCCNIFVVQQLISLAVCLVSYYKKCKDVYLLRANLIQMDVYLSVFVIQAD